MHIPRLPYCTIYVRDADGAARLCNMFNCKLASRDLGVARAACAHVFRLQFSVLGRNANANGIDFDLPE